MKKILIGLFYLMLAIFYVLVLGLLFLVGAITPPYVLIGLSVFTLAVAVLLLWEAFPKEGD